MQRRFNIILSDIPWRYKDKAGKRGADKKYATLTARELREIPLREIAADDCAHFMWTTGPMMPLSLELMHIYGFAYKNIAFTWVKQNKNNESLFTGMGHYTRSNTEFVLLGMRGRLARESKSVHSVVIAPRGRHSAKPPEIRDKIVELFGDIPRVELFARDRCPGWVQTGLEMDGMDIRRFINMQLLDSR